MDLIKKLLSFLEPKEKIVVFVILLGMIVAAGLEACGLGILLFFVSFLRDPSILSRYPTVKETLHTLQLDSDSQVLLCISGSLTLFYILKNVYLTWFYHQQFKFVYRKQTSLAQQLLSIYLHKPYVFHLQKNSAGILKNVTDEVLSACHSVAVPLLVLISELLLISVLLATLLFVDSVVALLALLMIGGLGWFFLSAIQRKLKIEGEAKQAHFEQMITWVNQSLGSIKEVKILGKEGFFVSMFGSSSDGFSRSLRYVSMIQQLPRLFIETTTMCFIALAIFVIKLQGKNPQEILPLLALFGMAAMRLIPSMGRIASMITMLRFFKPAVNVVHRDFEENKKNLSQTSVKQHELIQLKECLVLQHLSFKYPSTDSHSVRNVSLSIRQGSTIAIIGPSGSGKTTLIDLILGILQPTTGRILVDGNDIHENLRGWQENIGYIPQLTYLLDDSLKRNVAFGFGDEKIDEDKVHRVLASAQLEPLLASLPHGLQTKVGERGSRLSGGERQRLGIARALYYDPEVLIMDEPTSSLDYATEHEVIQTINAMKGEKTIIIITHRLSTVRNCDEVYRIEDGKLSGPWQYDEIVSLSTGEVVCA